MPHPHLYWGPTAAWTDSVQDGLQNKKCSRCLNKCNYNLCTLAPKMASYGVPDKHIYCWLPTSSYPDGGYRNHAWLELHTLTVFNSHFLSYRTLIKQGPYGRKPVVKRAIVVTPGSLVKVWKLSTCNCSSAKFLFGVRPMLSCAISFSKNILVLVS